MMSQWHNNTFVRIGNDQVWKKQEIMRFVMTGNDGTVITGNKKVCETVNNNEKICKIDPEPVSWLLPGVSPAVVLATARLTPVVHNIWTDSNVENHTHSTVLFVVIYDSIVVIIV